jgi:hypothetical protein
MTDLHIAAVRRGQRWYQDTATHFSLADRNRCAHVLDNGDGMYRWSVDEYGRTIACGSRPDATDALGAAETALYAYAHGLGGAA